MEDTVLLTEREASYQSLKLGAQLFFRSEVKVWRPQLLQLVKYICLLQKFVKFRVIKLERIDKHYF